MLWVFTRATEQANSGQPVIIVSKSLKSQRMFITFGTLESAQFKFFKNQEVPEFYYCLETDTYPAQGPAKALHEDYLDFEMTLLDNGDDKVCLQSKLPKTLFKPFSSHEPGQGAEPRL